MENVPSSELKQVGHEALSHGTLVVTGTLNCPESLSYQIRAQSGAFDSKCQKSCWWGRNSWKNMWIGPCGLLEPYNK